jgi:hypothetical protein
MDHATTPAPVATDDGLDALTLPQLRERCRAGGVRPARTKGETVARLRAALAAKK